MGKRATRTAARFSLPDAVGGAAWSEGPPPTERWKYKGGHPVRGESTSGGPGGAQDDQGAGDGRARPTGSATDTASAVGDGSLTTSHVS